MSRELLSAWFGVAADAWPPDHYRLLGLPAGEADLALIEQRVHQRMDAVRRYQVVHPETATEAMNRLAQAWVCLADPGEKKTYDAALAPASPTYGLAPADPVPRVALLDVAAPEPPRKRRRRPEPRPRAREEEWEDEAERRPWGAILGGSAAVVLVLAAGAAWVVTGMGKPPAPKVEVVPGLVEVAAGGWSEALISAAGDGTATPTFPDLPEGVEARVVPVRQEAGRAVFRATFTAAAHAGPHHAETRVLVGGQPAPFRLAVRVAPAQPRFAPIEAVVLRDGASADVPVRVRVQGTAGPWGVRLSGLPEFIRQEVPAWGQGEWVMRLSAPSGTGAGRWTATLELFDGPDVVARTRFPVEVRPLARALALFVPELTTVQAGTSALVSVRVARTDFDGPVTLHLEGLPPGVTADRVTVPAGKAGATFTLTASLEARADVRHTARVVGEVDGVRLATGDFRLLVEKSKTAARDGLTAPKRVARR